MDGVKKSHFRIAVKSIQERFFFCTICSNFLEELAEIENVIGHQFIKLLTGHGGSYTAKDSYFDNYTIIWENINVLHTTNNGSQHISVGENLAQNISKLFPEHVQISKKKLIALVSKITGIVITIIHINKMSFVIIE